jgi:uncharacterized protein YhaN
MDEDTEGIVGLPVEDAAAAVAADGGPDPETARAVLSEVAVDGVVTREGVDEAIAHLAKVVSTPETRAEFAAISLADAREAAVEAGVDDVDAVASRLATFEARLDAVEADVAALGADLQALLARSEDPESVYDVAADVRRLTTEANETQRAADELGVDVEEFEEWLDSHEARVEDVADDVDAVAGSVDELSAVAARLAGVDDGGDVDVADPELAWADATLRRRLLDLLAADVRADLADVRTLAARTDDGDAAAEAAEAGVGVDDLSNRLDGLDDDLATVRDRLDAAAEPAWRERHGDAIEAFEADLDGVEPPVDWATVQAALNEARTAVGATG